MKKLAILLFAMTFALLYAGLASAQEDDTAQVRIGHFAPDAPSVDIYVGGTISALQNVSFGDVSAWYELPVGTYTFAVVPAGEDVSEAVLEATLDLEADSWYSVFAIGLVENETLELDVVEEDYSSLTFGETRISFYHAIPEFLPVNVQDGDDVLAFLAFPDTVADEGGVAAPNLKA